MTVRVTLRLPESVYERLAKASRESGRSLNQVMVDALQDADLDGGPPADATDFEKLRWAARHRAPPWTDEADQMMGDLFGGGDDPDAPVLTREELWALMPKLPPEKWLSMAVIEDREESEDRF